MKDKVGWMWIVNMNDTKKALSSLTLTVCISNDTDLCQQVHLEEDEKICTRFAKIKHHKGQMHQLINGIYAAGI